MIDLLPTPAALVEPSLAIVAANAAMSDLLDAEDGLARIDGHLIAVRDTERLRSAVRDALDVGPRLLHLERTRSAGRPFVVGATALPTASGTLCILRIADTDRPPTIAAAAIAELYLLTPAQTLVAADIAQGLTLEAIATDRGIAIGTLRRHLHEIFKKTGTGSQSALTSLLLSIDRLVGL
jgi:DNA-binding NarL/FixJ family response regulator